MDCPHFDDGKCKIASALCNLSVKADIAGCTACFSDKFPQQINRVTVGKAVAAVLDNGGNANSLLRDFAHVLYPGKSIVSKVISYAEALALWAAKGFRVRSEEQVKELYRNVCGKCPLRSETYDPAMSICGACGCLLSEDPNIRNKLFFETEHCPQGKF